MILNTDPVTGAEVPFPSNGPIDTTTTLVNNFKVASLPSSFAVSVLDKMVRRDWRGADRESVMAKLRAGELMNSGLGLFGPVAAPVELADMFRRCADICRNNMRLAMHPSTP